MNRHSNPCTGACIQILVHALMFSGAWDIILHWSNTGWSSPITSQQTLPWLMAQYRMYLNCFGDLSFHSIPCMFFHISACLRFFCMYQRKLKDTILPLWRCLVVGIVMALLLHRAGDGVFQLGTHMARSGPSRACGVFLDESLESPWHSAISAKCLGCPVETWTAKQPMCKNTCYWWVLMYLLVLISKCEYSLCN